MTVLQIPTINGKENGSVSTCSHGYEPSCALWIRVPETLSEWLEILVCSDNCNRLQQKSSSNTCCQLRQKWKQSGNTGVAVLCGCEKLLSRMSTSEIVAWRYKACLLHGRVFSFHVHCLFVRQRHSALWDTLNCDILVAEVPPELVTDLSCSFYCSHPTSCKLVNEHFFSTIEPLYSCISRHMYRLTNQKVSTYVLKNHKLVYP